MCNVSYRTDARERPYRSYQQNVQFVVEEDGRPPGATQPHPPDPRPYYVRREPTSRHSRDGGSGVDGWGPSRASVLSPPPHLLRLCTAWPLVGVRPLYHHHTFFVFALHGPSRASVPFLTHVTHPHLAAPNPCFFCETVPPMAARTAKVYPYQPGHAEEAPPLE